MKKTIPVRPWAVLPAIIVGLAAVAGCDQGSDINALTVTPEHVELSRNQETVRFSVTGGLRDLSLPLTWEVSNETVGNIVAWEGTDAEYVRFTTGINIVMVKDQYGAEGYATVTSAQPADSSGPGAGYNLTLVANPSSQLPEGVNTVAIKVINGEEPFAWSVGDPSKGAVTPGVTGDTVTYTSFATGDNTVICEDRNSARGSLVITQLPLQ